METLNKSCHQLASNTHFLTPKTMCGAWWGYSLTGCTQWTDHLSRCSPAHFHTQRVCQTASVGAQLGRWQGKNLVNSVCFPETETFLETPLAPGGTLMSRGGCWTRSKVTKLFSYQLFTSKSKDKRERIHSHVEKVFCMSQAPSYLTYLHTEMCFPRQWREKALGCVPSWCKLTQLLQQSCPFLSTASTTITGLGLGSSRV